MNIVISVLFGIVMGVSIASLVVICVLEKNINFGDNKGDFKAFSKFPIRMISESNSNGLF